MFLRIRTHVALALVVVMLSWPAASRAQTGLWAQFRGPNGTGVSATTGLPAEFGPAAGVAWKASLPAGHSSPVLTATRIFVTAHTADKENYALSVIALDRASGKILWEREVPRRQIGRTQNPNGPASPSCSPRREGRWRHFRSRSTSSRETCW